MMVKLAIDKNDKNMITNWWCNYTEMVILTCSFCVLKFALQLLVENLLCKKPLTCLSIK